MECRHEPHRKVVYMLRPRLVDLIAIRHVSRVIYKILSPHNANSIIWTPSAQYGRQQHNMDAISTIWMPTAQYGRQQHNVDANSKYGCQQHNVGANSTIWTPTTHEIRQKVVRTAKNLRRKM